MNFDSYADAGVRISVELVNALAPRGERAVPEADGLSVVAAILAFDPPSLDALRPSDVPGFVGLGQRLRAIFDGLDGGNVDAAAEQLNDLLLRHPARPHLAKEEGVWRLHHHPVDAALVPMYTMICAEALARMIGAGNADRLGTCRAPDCQRVFVDTSKNGSRRFCSTTCQNRVKAAAFRLRHGASGRETVG